jgi:hypothetical protein
VLTVATVGADQTGESARACMEPRRGESQTAWRRTVEARHAVLHGCTCVPRGADRQLPMCLPGCMRGAQLAVVTGLRCACVCDELNNATAVAEARRCTHLASRGEKQVRRECGRCLPRSVQEQRFEVGVLLWKACCWVSARLSCQRGLRMFAHTCMNSRYASGSRTSSGIGIDGPTVEGSVLDAASV